MSAYHSTDYFESLLDVFRESPTSKSIPAARPRLDRLLVGPGTKIRYQRTLRPEEAVWLAQSLLRRSSFYAPGHRLKSISRTALTPYEQDGLRTYGPRGTTLLAELMHARAINAERPFYTEDAPVLVNPPPELMRLSISRGANFNGYGGHFYDDEYGALFGEGGLFQKIFRPQKYREFRLQEFAQSDLTDPSDLPLDFEFQPAADQITVSDEPDRPRNIFARIGQLFSRRNRGDRSETRAQRSLSRVAGEIVDSPVSGEGSATKYRINADGSVTQLERIDNTWSAVASHPAGSNRATSAIRSAQRARGERITSGIAQGVSLLPSILASFGINMPGQPPAQELPPQQFEELTGQQQPTRPPWLIPVIAGGAALVVVGLLVKGKRSAPAPAPAQPRRRRAR